MIKKIGLLLAFLISTPVLAQYQVVPQPLYTNSSHTQLFMGTPPPGSITPTATFTAVNTNTPTNTPTTTFTGTPTQGVISAQATPSVFSSQSGNFFAASGNSIIVPTGFTWSVFAGSKIIGESGAPGQIGVAIGSANGTGNNTVPAAPTAIAGITDIERLSVVTGYAPNEATNTSCVVNGPATLYVIPYAYSSGSLSVTFSSFIFAIPR